jgi:hypothetical protein
VNKTPVLITGFNRPDLLEVSLNFIQKVIGEVELFVHLDGPRHNNESDFVEIQKCKALVQNKFADYQFKLESHSVNLGCRFGMECAITWFFKFVDRGIIIEDDVILNLNSFSLAKSSLEYFEDDFRVGSISLYNPLPSSNSVTINSYFLSPIPQLWGWATWRNRWYESKEDFEIPTESLSTLRNWKIFLMLGKRNFNHWLFRMRRFEQNPWDTWDIGYIKWFWKNQYLSVIFPFNSVENIGFDERATHTKQVSYEPKFDSLNLARFERSDISYLKSNFIRKSFVSNALFNRRMHSEVYKIPNFLINPRFFLHRLWKRNPWRN